MARDMVARPAAMLLAQAREFARQALACVTADDVRALPLP
jgi:hypothetical protein